MTQPEFPIPVCVLGATGSVGQRFISLLDGHPWFDLVAVAASSRSAGKTYGEAVRWSLPEPMPKRVASMVVRSADDIPRVEGRIAFSALDSDVAGPIEKAFAADGRFVVTNAKNHRMDPRVPLIVPEANADHLTLLESQDFGEGRILANPNCSTIGLVLALKPLADSFGFKRASVTTMQALSGAGLGGPTAFGMTDNLIPFISGEEEKLENETKKILDDAHCIVSAQCNRVGVVDGHTLCISVELENEASAPELIQTWREFRGEPQELQLPSAPKHPTIYIDAPDAPQPRLHRELEGGMATALGRLRECSVLDWKFVALSHNTLRGAAGGAILAAELAVAKEFLPG
ncbi:MAG: aspartate-semialdehyde dehydrogenase [Planctomycetes bacterium]|jgi:aspartate-semialdehyde dehydrogenase|nr:aspartate-semialdehyde dehydrogenase [Planctomycetota bacterium]